MKRKLHPAVLLGWLMFLVAAAVLLIQHHRGSHESPYSKQPLTPVEEEDYSKSTGMKPEQMARNFLDACGTADWDETLKYLPPELLKKDTNFLDQFKGRTAGLQLVSLGTPFKGTFGTSGTKYSYPGVFVPYEVRLKSGEKIHWQLAIRCDNPEHHWYWDGGL